MRLNAGYARGETDSDFRSRISEADSELRCGGIGIRFGNRISEIGIAASRALALIAEGVGGAEAGGVQRGPDGGQQADQDGEHAHEHELDRPHLHR